MHDFTPIPSLIGGALIGLAASLFLLTHGRVAGISGLFGGLVRQERTIDRADRLAFLAGLFAVGVVVRVVAPSAFETTATIGWGQTLAAGLLVGFGTQLGSGCTSGHGVCGVSRLSVRSLVATGTFMATGLATVFVMRHVIGGGR